MNKRELFTRSITGLLIVVVSIAAILWSPFSYLSFITLIAIIGVREYFQMEEEKPGIIFQYLVALLFGSIIFFCGFLLITRHNPMVLFIVLPCLICGILVLQLMSYNVPQSLVNKGKAIYTAASYICLPLISGTIFLLDEYQPRYVLVPVLLIWANDVGAYMTGSLWGTKKIAPTISPGKSVQGTIGGFVITLVCAFIIWKIWPDLNISYLIILSLATPCFALTGDLWESALKRKSGVKDSGNILPGHGGILDRYDSFLFVLPVAALAYYIFVL